jgi:hypothetical protein
MTGEPRENDRRVFRVDILIAVCALLMSTLATAASWWQSRVVATQLSSQVWPYVAITSTSGPGGLEVDVTNEGLGPAVIRSIQLMVDGKAYPTFLGAERALLGAHAPVPHGVFATVGQGSVIRIGGSVQLIKIASPALVRAILPQTNRIDLRVCYCSILGDCWTRSSLGSQDPVRVNACPVDGPAHYGGAGLPP